MRVIVENIAVAQAIQALARERHWEGSASDLLPLLENKVGETTRKHRRWPTSPSALGAWLGRLAPALRAADTDAEGWDEARVLALVKAAVLAVEVLQAAHDAADGPAADRGAERAKAKRAVQQEPSARRR